MLARFFIDRPIFAWVISIVIVLFGLAAYLILPVAQYPEITPPTVEVSCVYPGANADVVQKTVAAPIEQQVNGVEGSMYMSSTSANNGSYSLTVTFELGTDLNMAQVLVQNRVAQAAPKLPPEVQTSGVTVKKRSPSILLVVNLYSEINPATGKPAHNQLKLSNFATIDIKDELARLKGIGDISLLGQQDYSMRIWIDPDKLAARNMTAGDVVNALREQNVQVAAGQIGQPPVPTGQQFQYTVSAQGRLETEQQFTNIVLKSGDNGRIVYLRDVGRAELGAQNEDTACRLDGKASVGLAIFQLPGSNALEVANGKNGVKAKMKELEKQFPPGLKYAIVYDTTPFIDQSIHEVLKTLFEAIVLVALVVLFFLQDWKAVILPLIDVVVSLVGTLAILYLMGFSLNNLTLFGLVLAIGIVVDDAIVVLENIERWIAMGYKVREATINAMGEITGPILAITLVLCSVFLPSAFLPGITGQFYRQFALTIAVSMILSATNAMTMTPARAGSIFKDPKPGEQGHEHREALPWWGIACLGGLLSYWLVQSLLGDRLGLGGESHGERADLGTAISEARIWGMRIALFLPGALLGWWFAPVVNKLLGVFFRGFNVVFDRITAGYGIVLGRMLRISVVVLVVYGGLLGLTWFGFTRIPVGFIPMQDQGYLVVDFQLPDSAALERTVAVAKQLECIAHDIDGVAHTVAVPGQSFVLNSFSSNFGGMFIVLKPFEERKGAKLSADAIMVQLQQRYYKEIEEARVSVFGAPPVQGLGNTGGFKLMIEDRGSLGLEKLQGQADNLAERASKFDGFIGVFNTLRSDTPQLFADIDRVKCKTMRVPLTEVNSALQVFLGGYYVNDFNRFGRTWQVNVQSEASFRVTADKVKLLKVRNADGDMVPLGSVLTIRDAGGPVLINRYNTYPAAALNGVTLPSVSTGTVIRDMEKLADDQLPRGMFYEWTEITFLQIQAGSSAIFAFIGAVVLVFLVLAAQYESWSLPFSVILVVPMCLLSAIVGIAMAHMDINIFVQVGFVVLVGLASKNAILVVEFARELQHKGKSPYQAAIEASTVRLRPIVMTSFAFILGVVPLVLGTGAGAEMRRTLGTAVFSGMLGVTIFGIFLTPVFYYVVDWLSGGAKAPAVTGDTLVPVKDEGVPNAAAPTAIRETPSRH
jgi:multidrug efflux pump subunit AcrB